MEKFKSVEYFDIEEKPINIFNIRSFFEDIDEMLLKTNSSIEFLKCEICLHSNGLEFIGDEVTNSSMSPSELKKKIKSNTRQLKNIIQLQEQILIIYN
jgi:hypothetical protein